MALVRQCCRDGHVLGYICVVESWCPGAFPRHHHHHFTNVTQPKFLTLATAIRYHFRGTTEYTTMSGGYYTRRREIASGHQGYSPDYEDEPLVRIPPNTTGGPNPFDYEVHDSTTMDRPNPFDYEVRGSPTGYRPDPFSYQVDDFDSEDLGQSPYRRGAPARRIPPGHAPSQYYTRDASPPGNTASRPQPRMAPNNPFLYQDDDYQEPLSRIPPPGHHSADRSYPNAMPYQEADRQTSRVMIPPQVHHNAGRVDYSRPLARDEFGRAAGNPYSRENAARMVRDDDPPPAIAGWNNARPRRPSQVELDDEGWQVQPHERNEWDIDPPPPYEP